MLGTPGGRCPPKPPGIPPACAGTGAGYPAFGMVGCCICCCCCICCGCCICCCNCCCCCRICCCWGHSPLRLRERRCLAGNHSRRRHARRHPGHCGHSCLRLLPGGMRLLGLARIRVYRRLLRTQRLLLRLLKLIGRVRWWWRSIRLIPTDGSAPATAPGFAPGTLLSLALRRSATF